MGSIRYSMKRNDATSIVYYVNTKAAVPLAREEDDTKAVCLNG